MNDNEVIDVPLVTGEIIPNDAPARHRWSGWPGAWCLDCGQEDQNEYCIAVHSDGLVCIEGHMMCEKHELKGCPEHVNGPCSAPGQMLADPYAFNDARRKLLALLSQRAS